MGMFDYIEFQGDTAFGLQKRGDWQTKDLYCALYKIVVKDDRTYYRNEATGVLHKLGLTATFEIHAAGGWSFNVHVEDGFLVRIWRNQHSLPPIVAMDRDDNLVYQEMKEIVEGKP